MNYKKSGSIIFQFPQNEINEFVTGKNMTFPLSVCHVHFIWQIWWRYRGWHGVMLCFSSGKVVSCARNKYGIHFGFVYVFLTLQLFDTWHILQTSFKLDIISIPTTSVRWETKRISVSWKSSNHVTNVLTVEKCNFLIFRRGFNFVYASLNTGTEKFLRFWHLFQTFKYKYFYQLTMTINFSSITDFKRWGNKVCNRNNNFLRSLQFISH